MKGRMGKLYRFKLRFGKNVPHIVWDGIVDEKAKDKKVVCLSGNTNATFANLDAENGFKKISREAKPYECILQPLMPVQINVK
jgi:hypothetical protein